MNRLVDWLVIVAVAATVLGSAEPRLASLASAAVPLVLSVGAVIAVLRLVWHYTNRY